MTTDITPEQVDRGILAPLSPAREAQIRERAEAATPGPWCNDDWEIYQGEEYQPGISQWIGETCRGTTTLEQDRADAAFAAHARTDVPALLTELDRIRADHDEMATELASAQGQWEAHASEATARTAERDQARGIAVQLENELARVTRRSYSQQHVWQVWGGPDEGWHGLYASEDAAKTGSIECWEEGEAHCPDYSWQSLPHGDLELLAGGDRTGIWISRRDVFGQAPATPSCGQDSRTERSYWCAIAEALNAAVAAGMPVGIDLDGTLTDHNAWSVVWDRSAERWAVAGYDEEPAAESAESEAGR